MMTILNRLFLGSLLLVVVGCGALNRAPDAAATRPVVRPDGGIVPAENATSVEDFDTTTQAERDAAATTISASEHEIGRTVVSLGNAAEPGFWLETPLVDAPGMGRVVFVETGKSVAVQLKPIEGPVTAGSRISLAALRILEAPLTGLVEVAVFANKI